MTSNMTSSRTKYQTSKYSMEFRNQRQMETRKSSIQTICQFTTCKWQAKKKEGRKLEENKIMTTGNEMPNNNPTSQDAKSNRGGKSYWKSQLGSQRIEMQSRVHNFGLEAHFFGTIDSRWDKRFAEIRDMLNFIGGIILAESQRKIRSNLKKPGRISRICTA